MRLYKVTLYTDYNKPDIIDEDFIRHVKAKDFDELVQYLESQGYKLDEVMVNIEYLGELYNDYREASND